MSFAEFLFLTLLILVSFATYNTRNCYFQHHKQAYTKLLSGYFLWFLLLMVRTVISSPLGEYLPLLAQTVAGSLLEAFLLVAGGLCLAAGVIEWIPALARDAAASRQQAGHDSRKQAETSLQQRLLIGLRKKLTTFDCLADALPIVDGYLRKLADYDLLRLAIYDTRGQNVTQYCLGNGRNLLTERNKSISTCKTSLGEVFQSGEMARCDDLLQSSFDDDKWLFSCGVRSAITIPFKTKSRVEAAITLASEESENSLRLDESLIAELPALLLPLIKADSLARELHTYNRQILDITSVLKQMVSSAEPASLLAGIAEMLVSQVPISNCRIWRYSESDNSISVQAEKSAHHEPFTVGNLSIVPLAGNYWHRKAIEGQRLIIIDQSDETMSMEEDEQQRCGISGMNSALLLPLVSDGKTIGLLSLVEMRSRDRRRFSLQETLFARGMGNVAAEVLARSENKRRYASLNRRIQKFEQDETIGGLFIDLPRRLATPLTSIMAHTDQILKTLPDTDSELTRSLRTIKRQAEKITCEVRAIGELRHEQYRV